LFGLLAFATPQIAFQGASPIGTPSPQASGFGTIQGTVVREGTTSPIPDVQITLGERGMTLEAAQAIFNSQGRGVNVPPDVVQEALAAAQRGAQPSLSAVSDQNGQFTITNVPAGDQNLRAQLEGYFAEENTGNFSTVVMKLVTVERDKVARVQVGMVPAGSFSGRVLDSSGRPVSDAPVQVFRANYQNGFCCSRL